jgi:hypothetical protein
MCGISLAGLMISVVACPFGTAKNRPEHWSHQGNITKKAKHALSWEHFIRLLAPNTG